MDFIRQQLVIVQERLRGLSPSQKMLAATLVVIMAMTMLYWGKFAANRDMVALAPAGINAAAMQAARAALTANGISFDDSGGVLRVQASQHEAAIGAIAAVIASPSSTGSNELETMLDKLSPLSTQGELNARLQNVRNLRIENMIGSWSGVKTVTLQVSESMRGGLTPTPAGASVSITTNPGADARKLANAALAAVMPIIPHLKRDGITVLVDGQPRITPTSGDGGGFGSGDFIETRNAVEAGYVQDIKRLYPDIAGLQVSVTADITASTMQEKINSIDPINKLSLSKESTSEKTTTTEAAAPAEPGAVTNMGVSASDPIVTARGGSKTERTEEQNENFVGTKETLIATPAGQVKILAATVRVPRDHFAKVWRVKNKGAEATEEQLDGLVTNELGKIRSTLMTRFQIKDEGNVVVNDYVGLEDPNILVANNTVTAGTGGTLSLLDSSHGKEVAIGALALTSLFMVGRMVKKSSPPAVAPLLALDDMPDISTGGGKKSRRVNQLGGVEIVGEVGEGGSIMMGQELDEEVLETSQMVEQVTGFVKEHPDTTAQLLRRWMNRD